MKNKEGLLHIGQIAKESGVGVETIRFYEREEILPKPKRKPSGYRLFTEETVAKIKTIKRMQEFGFTLFEIRALVRKNDYGWMLVQLDKKIDALKSFRKELAKQASKR